MKAGVIYDKIDRVRTARDAIAVREARTPIAATVRSGIRSAAMEER
jgi:hypothetical protein